MIQIKCTAPDMINISSLKPFQGDLKKRTDKDIKALADSLSTEGLLMPFAVWQAPTNEYLLLDGHGRLAALKELADTDKDIQEQEYPCIKISAESEVEARKALLQITSSYGKITKEGAIKFCATIPEYKAPSINKYVHKPVARIKKETQKTVSVIKITIPTDKVEDVKALLSQVPYIKVM